MKKYRKTKSTVVLEELTEKLRNGVFPVGSRFASKEQLAQQYKISTGTAGKILHELRDRGYLSMGRGRYTIVQEKSAAAERLRLAKPVGLICSDEGPFHFLRWRDWLLHHLQKRLLQDGNFPLWLQDDMRSKDLLENCCGLLLIGEETFRMRQQLVDQTGLPCVSVSFAGPLQDCVFVDYRGAVTELFVYLMGKSCRDFILLGHSDDFCKDFLCWHAGMGFVKNALAYGIGEDHFHLVSWDISADSSVEALKKCAMSLAGRKFSVHVSYPGDHGLIIQALNGIGLELERDYFLVSYSMIPDEFVPGCVIDMKCGELVEILLELFYSRIATGVLLPGRILSAGFVEKNW